MNEKTFLSHEVETYKWWSKVRWFIVLILFAIGILRVTQINQTYPIVIFVATFLGICILNVLFYLQIIKTNALYSSLQIVLDIVFATVVVHLTGGLDSSFVWIYLVAVITASLAIENSGGVLAAMIGSMCLLILILMYNFGWLTPIDGMEYEADIPTQTIFLISYTGLFSGIAFISSYISTIMKQYTTSTQRNTQSLNDQQMKLSDKETELINNRKLLEKYREVVQESAMISDLDHDLNNPLTIVSLSIRRIIKAAHDYNDDKLEKSGNQMTEAINKINEILIKFQKLKQLDLIQEERNKQQG
ncbi:MAG: histidine kinase [Candidatus Cloacimonetes bacterium]|jgi:signal transduction histidine kinase|nr:histidine kinase [Candidatus Cloacimonadota bacterium]MBT4333889.1 histidine kinase [Candidatus Cloacimonadota bacterium]MBT5420287.1 histidine kinase [Candidatus Cloacimonadota bacterium]